MTTSFYFLCFHHSKSFLLNSFSNVTDLTHLKNRAGSFLFGFNFSIEKAQPLFLDLTQTLI